MLPCARAPLPGCLVVLLGFWSVVAAAPDGLLIQTNHYSLTGAMLPELHRSLDQRRPRAGSGRHHGWTVWKIDWRTDIRQQGQASRVASFTTRTRINITLPQWIVPTNAAPGLAQVWNDYLSALHEHEDGPAQLVRGAVADMHARVKSLPSSSEAGALRQQVDALAREILAMCNHKNQEYHRRTRHGDTQGAMFSARQRQRSQPSPPETVRQ